MSEQQTYGVMEHSFTSDGKAIIVDCGFCGGCGEGDASGYDCPVCDGRGFDVYPLPKRDYEAAGMRAFKAGKLLSDCPYRFGWPMIGWCRGYEYAEEEYGQRCFNFFLYQEAESPALFAHALFWLNVKLLIETMKEELV